MRGALGGPLCGRARFLAAILLAIHPAGAWAQNLDTTRELEELIPDSALSDPQAWAADGVPPEEPTPIDDAAQPPQPEPDADSPMADLPGLSVDWPATPAMPDTGTVGPAMPTLDLPAPTLPDEGRDVSAASAETGPAAPPPIDIPADLTAPELPDLRGSGAVRRNDTVRLGGQLLLGLPPVADFAVRDQFVNRFRGLSTIELYGKEDANIAQLAARAGKDADLLDEILRNYGYYDGQVIRSVVDGGGAGASAGAGAGGGEAQVRFDVLPGPRYQVGDIDLGQLAEAPDAATLREAFEIQPGDPLSNDAIMAEREDLDIALGELGYPLAQIDEPALTIDHAAQAGALSVVVRPHGKYLFGAITSTREDLLPGRHLQTIARFDPGQVYQRSLSQDLRRAILATGLVSSVTITPREATPPTQDAPGTVNLDVAITKARPRTVTGSIGYGSEEGIRLEAAWEHRNLFPPEGALRVRGVAGTQEQLFGVTLRKNNFGGRDRVLTVDAFASTLDNPAFDANTASIIGSYGQVSNFLYQKPLSWTVGLELVATDERPAAVDGARSPRTTYLIAALPLYSQIDTSDSLLDPTEGYRLSGRLSPELSRSDGAQNFYLRGRVDASLYHSVSDRVVMAGRLAYGSIVGTGIENIAPSRRYYAGGGGSVRGYGYRQIGPRNEDGEPTGGRSVMEAAIEARIRTGFMDGAVSVVPFLDAGTVSTSTTPDFETFRVGAGLGVRYLTNFGPIRVDVGVPINPGPNDSPVAVYVSLGQAF